MKKTLCLVALFFLVTSLNAQTRYYEPIFDSLDITRDVYYGSNYSYDALKGEVGLTQVDLHLDIYKPHGDVLGNRPLIVWVHGGYYLQGTKMDDDAVRFSEEFAKRGFVCASIDYRLGFEQPIDSIYALRTAYRSIQDARAAIRFLRSKADSLGIDKERVYIGGISAGAITAMNVGFFNVAEEVPEYLDTNERLSINTQPGFGLDGLEGLTNTIKESSKVAGVIGVCGATKHVSWLDDEESSQIPIIMIHGSRDATVPYGKRIIMVNDVLTQLPPEPRIPLIEVQGSYDIDQHADEMGYTSRLYTWYFADHSPHYNFKTDSVAELYMDTAIQFTSTYVYHDFLGMPLPEDGLYENAVPCDYNNGDSLPCATFIEETQGLQKRLYLKNHRIYGGINQSFEVYQSDGQLIDAGVFNPQGYPVDRLRTGFYIVKSEGLEIKLLR